MNLLVNLAGLFNKRGFFKAANLCDKLAAESESEKLRLVLEQAKTPQERRDALLNFNRAKEIEEKGGDKELERLKGLAKQRRLLLEHRRQNPVQEVRTKYKTTPGLSPDRDFDAVEEVVAPSVPKTEKPKMTPIHSPMPKPTRPGAFKGQSVSSWVYTPFYIKLETPLPDGRKGFMGKRKSKSHDWIWDGEQWLNNEQWTAKFKGHKKEEDPQIFDGEKWVSEKEFAAKQNPTAEDLEKGGKYPEIKMMKLLAKTNFDTIKEGIRSLPFSVISLNPRSQEVDDMKFSYLEGKVMNKGKHMDEKSAHMFFERVKLQDKNMSLLFISDRTGKVSKIFPEENTFMLKDFFNQKITVEHNESTPAESVEEKETLVSPEPEHKGRGGVNIF